MSWLEDDGPRQVHGAIDSTVSLDGGAHCSADGVEVPRVEWNDVAVDLARKGSQVLRVSPGEDELRAARRETTTERAADTACCADDEDERGGRGIHERGSGMLQASEMGSVEPQVNRGLSGELENLLGEGGDHDDRMPAAAIDVLACAIVAVRSASRGASPRAL